MNATRQARREVRNPVLGLPGALQAIAALAPDCRRALAAILRAIRRDALARADESWRRHKGPMAAYWKAVGVYAGHVARAIDVAPAGPDAAALAGALAVLINERRANDGATWLQGASFAKAERLLQQYRDAGGAVEFEGMAAQR